MVSLIEHAADARTREPSSWLLAGSVAALLIAIVATIVALADYRRLAALYRPLAVALLFGAAAALAIGSARPAPWPLATLLDLILIAIWSLHSPEVLRTTRDGAQSRLGHARGRPPSRSSREAQVRDRFARALLAGERESGVPQRGDAAGWPAA
jgi:hypothetical protein